MQHGNFEEGPAPDEVALEDLRMLQRTNPPVVSEAGSVYLRGRKRLVNWVANVCTKFGLKPLTVHVAVQHMDKVLLGAASREENMFHFALAAIMLAAKMEESPDAVPLVSELQTIEAAFDTNQLQEIELHIMKTLDWRLVSCTYVHFLNIHVNQGVSYSQDRLDGRPVLEKEKTYLIKYVFFFADVCVLESDFLSRTTSLTSAAIIGAARFTVGIEPVWPPELQGRTGYSAQDIAECVSSVVAVFFRDYPSSVPPSARARMGQFSPTSVDGSVVNNEMVDMKESVAIETARQVALFNP